MKRTATVSSPRSDDEDSSRKRCPLISIKESKERAANKICLVCGDKAYSFNFNVSSCESCKAFFRRNANKENELKCPFKNSCDVILLSRRFCQRCRLMKCFQVGMKKEWIMTVEARQEKKARVEANRERRKQQPEAVSDQAAASLVVQQSHRPLPDPALLPISINSKERLSASIPSLVDSLRPSTMASLGDPSILARETRALSTNQQLMVAAHQREFLQQATPSLINRCCCACKCGKYESGRPIVDQAQEEWEATLDRRRANLQPNDMGLSALLPSNEYSENASDIDWLDTAKNQYSMIDSALATKQTLAMSVEEGHPELCELQDSYLNDRHFPPSQQMLGLKPIIDEEFGLMEKDDTDLLNFVLQTNKVGAIKRMILMARKFPAMIELHDTDQMKLYKSCYLDVMIIRGAMAYDPKENAWKGPTSDHDYKIKMDAMNDDATGVNMFEKSIRLYTMFKEEYRSDEPVMLLLNMIVLFDPNVEGLTNVVAVKNEQNRYKRCLKRYMFTKLHKNPNSTVQNEYKSLLDRLATVRTMTPGARGIMVEHADSMAPLLKELLEEDQKSVPKNTLSKAIVN